MVAVSFEAWPWPLATTRELRRSRSNPQAKLRARAVMAIGSFKAWPWPLATTRKLRRLSSDPQAKLQARAVTAATQARPSQSFLFQDKKVPFFLTKKVMNNNLFS
ncbi:hypothetical protein NL676_013771 [Syzygium grande]|nr:hypothetical protein NL676_013771 [Syzygium grande]